MTQFKRYKGFSSFVYMIETRNIGEVYENQIYRVFRDFY